MSLYIYYNVIEHIVLAQRILWGWFLMSEEEKDKRKSERRKGDLDAQFRYMISTGAFEERRKEERRKESPKKEELNIRIFFN